MANEKEQKKKNRGNQTEKKWKNVEEIIEKRVENKTSPLFKYQGKRRNVKMCWGINESKKRKKTRNWRDKNLMKKWKEREGETDETFL